MGISTGTGTKTAKFGRLSFGRQATGFKDSLMVQAGVTESEIKDLAEILGGTGSMKCSGFGLGSQFPAFTLPAAPTSIKQKINFLFTIKGEKRKAIYVRMPLHFDGTEMKDVLAVQTGLAGLTGLGIGEISEVTYKQEGTVRS